MSAEKRSDRLFDVSPSSPDRARREFSSPIRRRRPLTLHIPESHSFDDHFSKGKRLKRAQSEKRVVKRQVVDEHGRKRTKEIVEAASPIAQDAGTVIIHAPNQSGTTSSEEVCSSRPITQN